MKKKTRAERDLEKVLERIRSMTKEEWLEVLSWTPSGATETWRTATKPPSGGVTQGNIKCGEEQV
jgi:hypothetical protein